MAGRCAEGMVYNEIRLIAEAEDERDGHLRYSGVRNLVKSAAAPRPRQVSLGRR
jgi:hypothetical protein